MSGQLGELVVSMQLEMARFREDLGKANRAANDSMTRMAGDVSRSTTAMQRTMSGLAGTMGVTFSVAAVVGFTRETINAGLALEKLNMQFKASTGSTAASVRELDYVRKLSDSLGLSLQTTATSYSKFLAATRNTSIEGATAKKVFEGVSEAITALGLSAEISDGVFSALNQMMSKGKVSSEELVHQLGDRLPGALQLAADGMGMTRAQLMKQMELGNVMSAELLPKLAEQLHKTYGVAAVEASAKGQAGINRFKNEIFETSAAIGSHLMPALNSAANGIAEMLKQSRQGWGFNPGNLLEPFNSNTPGYNKASRAETFRIPKAGEAMSIGGREARIQARLAANAAIGSTVDPQMARIAADRRAEEDKINASRATAEKLAAGAADRDKAAKAALKKATQEQEVAQKAVNAGLREQNLLLEAAVKDWDLAGLGSGLTPSGGTLNWKPAKPTFSLTGADSTGFSQPGPSSSQLAQENEAALAARSEFAEIMATGNPYQEDLLWLQTHKAERQQAVTAWNDEEIGAAERKTAALAKIDQDYAAAKERLDIDTADTAAGSLANSVSTLGGIMMKGNRDQFEAGKALAIAGATIDTFRAAAGAYAALAPIPVVGPGLAALAAGAAIASGLAQVAVIESTQYQARAKGGPVAGGETYLVGEKGPELFTPGASGQITSNNNLQRLGGEQSVSVTNVFQISTGVSETVQAELGRMMPAIEARTTNAVKRAINGGTDLSTAVGRM